MAYVEKEGVFKMHEELLRRCEDKDAQRLGWKNQRMFRELAGAGIFVPSAQALRFENGAYLVLGDDKARSLTNMFLNYNRTRAEHLSIDAAPLFVEGDGDKWVFRTESNWMEVDLQPLIDEPTPEQEFLRSTGGSSYRLDLIFQVGEFDIHKKNDFAETLFIMFGCSYVEETKDLGELIDYTAPFFEKVPVVRLPADDLPEAYRIMKRDIQQCDNA